MFLKDDKYPLTDDLATYLSQEPDSSYGAPRCIQYRNKRYCLRLATYLHPIEEHCYAAVDWTDTPIFSKGRNLKQRGADLHGKWNSFVKPLALLLDHSKFDAHVTLQLLNMEHKFYRACNDSQELKDLLSGQLLNKGRTKNGTTYTTKATRMSGDQNTGLGNSLINYAMLSAFAKHFDLKHSIYVDGDDSVIIIENEGKHYDLKYFEQFGMKTKGSSTTEFSQVEFCQTRPVELDAGWTMVRNPYRLLLRTPWTVKQLTQRQLLPYMASVGRCELALGMGAPIGQYLGEKLAQLSHRHVITDLEYVAKQQHYRPLRAHLVPPSDAARESYYQAWNINPDQQREIEGSDICYPGTLSYYLEERPFVQ
ncbi:MAG: RNA-dependent RNA polymerase [Fushun naranga aenescens tombus-like virus 1]|nr:MAG: RNA-dependent RNA polymerase [Fushun naranga aenescens tombus-like virus 1]UHR49821.1 MAG: RNA-dependent RNA polymerase [Fushun naranga aenescens tombus-like virus 1]UHR49830.1 MAG: RNA-dependent RNA polymerase [Fushun naranga aenescens tombus-like virus 1]UHR49843.1 MAG: RNA-dependent RNA polymerase [Fushun naranga aenescens tombus-like virus 1]UHR49856.1 MAG: RNA-dependent RNA polymerase [Fushun naranga aenescens tombus-like virus 1]